MIEILLGKLTRYVVFEANTEALILGRYTNKKVLFFPGKWQIREKGKDSIEIRRVS